MATAAAIVLSCVGLRSPRQPMEVVTLVRNEAAAALVVLLPGRFDSPRDFSRRGVVERLHRARPDADVVAVDAHLGYYRAGTIRERLWQDVLEPASRRYEEIRLVGVSLGGTGALVLALHHREVVDGVVVLAPYLGANSLIAEIEAAGGPERWRAGAVDEGLARIWTGMRDRPREAGPEIFLGYGADDRRAAHHRLFARLLAADRVAERAGGHRWPVWIDLLDELVERGALGVAG